MELYPHQIECLGRIIDHRRAGHKAALVVMASGLGKTVTAASDVKHWLELHPRESILFICHQNFILDQAKAEFMAVLGPNHTYGLFTGEEKHVGRVTCLFASFQTLAKHKDLFARTEFGYIVVDESHHSHAKSWREVVQYFKPEFTLGITATPDRLDRKNIRQIFGNEVYSLSLEEALVRGLLTPVKYRLLADEISLKEVLDTPTGKLSIEHLNRLAFIPKRDEEIAAIIARHCAEMNNPRTIIFCSSIAHCNHFASFLDSCMAIHSKISARDRQIRLELFRLGVINTIVVVDTFNEGIDIPQANVLVFLRSTTSPTIFMQQLGRGLRKSEGKGEVLVLDFAGNCDRVEMVYNMWTKVRAEGEKIGKVKDLGKTENHDPARKGPFMIDVSEVNFNKTIIDLLDVVNRIRGGYTREYLIAQIKQLAEELGRTPSAQECDKRSRSGMAPSTKTLQNYFGSYNEALRACGLELNHHRQYSDEKGLIDQLKKYFENEGKVPTVSKVAEMSRQGLMSSPTTFVNYFQTWNGALIAAGLITPEGKVVIPPPEPHPEPTDDTAS